MHLYVELMLIDLILDSHMFKSENIVIIWFLDVFCRFLFLDLIYIDIFWRFSYFHWFGCNFDSKIGTMRDIQLVWFFYSLNDDVQSTMHFNMTTKLMESQQYRIRSGKRVSTVISIQCRHRVIQMWWHNCYQNAPYTDKIIHIMIYEGDLFFDELFNNVFFGMILNTIDIFGEYFFIPFVAKGFEYLDISLKIHESIDLFDIIESNFRSWKFIVLCTFLSIIDCIPDIECKNDGTHPHQN